MRKRSSTAVRPRLLAAIGSAALAALLATSCSSPPPSTTPPAVEQFCDLFDRVTDEPPEPTGGVLVKEDLVAYADDTHLYGESCTAPAARVELDGAVLGEGTEVPSEQGNPDSDPVPAITGEELGADEPVLDNLTVRALSAEIGVQGITVRGNVEVRLSGTTSTIGFVGTLSDLQNWSVGLSSSNLTIPGVTSTPATFSGSIRVVAGVPTLTLSAGVTTARIGDVVVSGAQVDFRASPADGVHASVRGGIKIGTASVQGAVSVDFDTTGALVAARADIGVRLRGAQVGGTFIDLEGDVKLRGDRDQTSISFTGSGTLGDLTVNQANGSLTLEPNKATFIGVLDIAQGPNSVRFDGAIVWDGVTAYTPFLQVQGQGEIWGTLDDGERVGVTGTLETTVVGGQSTTLVTGDFQLGWLRASGTAIVETDGATTSLYLDADLTSGGLSSRVEGEVIITDGVAERVRLEADVAHLAVGDLVLSDSRLSIESDFGDPLDISFDGTIEVGRHVRAIAEMDALIGPDGTIMSITGQVNGSLDLDGWYLEWFQGSLAATPERVTIEFGGYLESSPVGLSAEVAGTFTTTLATGDWVLEGRGRLGLGGLTFEDAKFRLTPTEFKALRVNFYTALLGFIPLYGGGDVSFRPDGSCRLIYLNGGDPYLRPIVATALELANIPCQVRYPGQIDFPI
jgi:hypothetical protein